jgi:hypothetical protein
VCRDIGVYMFTAPLINRNPMNLGHNFPPFRVYKLVYVITCNTVQLNTRQGAAGSNCKPLISFQGPERRHEYYYTPRAARTCFPFLRVRCSSRIVHKTWIGCCRVSENRERELHMRAIYHRGESLNPSFVQIQELIFFERWLERAENITLLIMLLVVVE